MIPDHCEVYLFNALLLLCLFNQFILTCYNTIYYIMSYGLRTKLGAHTRELFFNRSRFWVFRLSKTVT